MEHDLYPNDIWHKRSILYLFLYRLLSIIDNFETYSVFVAIAKNIPMLLITGFVVQGHKYILHILVYILYVYYKSEITTENTTFVSFLLT